MNRYFPVLCISLCASLCAFPSGSVRAQEWNSDTEPNELRLHLTGLPHDAEDGDLLIQTIRLRDGVITETEHYTPDPEIYLTQPSEPSLFRVYYRSLLPSSMLEGTGNSFLGSSANIAMSPQSRSGLSPSGALPTYPPQNGIAIGYNPSDFSASGDGLEPQHGKDLAAMVVTELVNSKCEEGSDTQFIVVESANPAGMAKLESEIRLQQSSATDPASRVEPHIIQATHRVKGSMTFGSNGAKINLVLTDGKGNVIARGSASSAEEQFWDAVDEAVRKLADEICKEKQKVWVGDIIYRLQMNSKQQQESDGTTISSTTLKEYVADIAVKSERPLSAQVSSKMTITDKNQFRQAWPCETPSNPRPGFSITDDYSLIETKASDAAVASAQVVLKDKQLVLSFSVDSIPEKGTVTERSKTVRCGKVVQDDQSEPQSFDGKTDPIDYRLEVDAGPDPDQQTGSHVIRTNDANGETVIEIKWNLTRKQKQ